MFRRQSVYAGLALVLMALTAAISVCRADDHSSPSSRVRPQVEDRGEQTYGGGSRKKSYDGSGRQGSSFGSGPWSVPPVVPAPPVARPALPPLATVPSKLRARTMAELDKFTPGIISDWAFQSPLYRKGKAIGPGPTSPDDRWLPYCIVILGKGASPASLPAHAQLTLHPPFPEFHSFDDGLASEGTEHGHASSRRVRVAPENYSNSIEIPFTYAGGPATGNKIRCYRSVIGAQNSAARRSVTMEEMQEALGGLVELTLTP